MLKQIRTARLVSSNSLQLQLQLQLQGSSVRTGRRGRACTDTGRKIAILNSLHSHAQHYTTTLPGISSLDNPIIQTQPNPIQHTSNLDALDHQIDSVPSHCSSREPASLPRPAFASAWWGNKYLSKWAMSVAGPTRVLRCISETRIDVSIFD